MALLGQDGLLTLKEVGERLGVGYGRMRGLADADGVGDWVGAALVPGVKGARYPESAVGKFGALVSAQDAGRVTLKTVPGYVADQRAAEARADAEAIPVGVRLPAALSAPVAAGDDALAPPGADPGHWLAHNATLSLLQALVDSRGDGRPESATAPGATAPDDRLLTSGEAATLLACRPRAVSRYVPPVLAGKWRRSDVLAFIAGLRPRGIIEP